MAKTAGVAIGTGDDLPTGAEGHDQWIVLLEAAPEPNASELDPGTAEALLHAMADEKAVGLRGRGRIAVQVPVRAGDAAIALSTVLSRWRDAVVSLGLLDWNVVRAEVLTVGEFQLEL